MKAKRVEDLCPGDRVVLDTYDDGSRDIATIESTSRRPVSGWLLWLVGDKLPVRVPDNDFLEVLP